MGGSGPDDDIETVQQHAPRQYETSALRHPVHVRWTDRSGERSVVLDRSMVIGSSADCPLLVDDAMVSRIHAELELRDDGVWVRDLGSRNGTFVNDVQVSLARLPERGTVRVGETLLVSHREATAERVALWASDRFGALLGGSVAMRELFSRLLRIAKTDSTVLVQGETGTGKELVARAIHDFSRRSAEPFVVVDCAALPETLLEAELFGHAKAAFTGAATARAGAIEAADGGTLFLDEVGELPMAMQPKLLRALESRSVRRLGETSHRKIDVRFVSATHRDLRTMVNQGVFREDLYFRLAVLPVGVPPLREHLEDVPLLMQSFLPPDAAAPLSREAMEEASRRTWPGNVRELRNFVERLVAFGEHDVYGELAAAPQPPAPEGDELVAALDRPLRDAREVWMNALEKAYLRRLLERCMNDVPRAAKAAGIDRTHVYRLIRKHER